MLYSPNIEFRKDHINIIQGVRSQCETEVFITQVEGYLKVISLNMKTPEFYIAVM